MVCHVVIDAIDVRIVIGAALNLDFIGLARLDVWV